MVGNRAAAAMGSGASCLTLRVCESGCCTRCLTAEVLLLTAPCQPFDISPLVPSAPWCGCECCRCSKTSSLVCSCVAMQVLSEQLYDTWTDVVTQAADQVDLLTTLCMLSPLLLLDAWFPHITCVTARCLLTWICQQHLQVSKQPQLFLAQGAGSPLTSPASHHTCDSEVPLTCL
jgi:hypothetical protein